MKEEKTENVKQIFEIGKEIHFMKNDKPVKAIIKGISTYMGE